MLHSGRRYQPEEMSEGAELLKAMRRGIMKRREKREKKELEEALRAGV